MNTLQFQNSKHGFNAFGTFTRTSDMVRRGYKFIPTVNGPTKITRYVVFWKISHSKGIRPRVERTTVCTRDTSSRLLEHESPYETLYARLPSLDDLRREKRQARFVPNRARRCDHAVRKEYRFSAVAAACFSPRAFVPPLNNSFLKPFVARYCFPYTCATARARAARRPSRFRVPFGTVLRAALSIVSAAERRRKFRLNVFPAVRRAFQFPKRFWSIYSNVNRLRKKTFIRGLKINSIE